MPPSAGAPPVHLPPGRRPGPSSRSSSRPAGRRAPRLFASRVDEPRSRRASDVLLLVVATLGLGLVSVTTDPPAGFERALLSLVASLPSGLDGLWQLFVDGFTLVAVGVLVAAAVRRRWALLRDLVLAAVAAVAIAVVVGAARSRARGRPSGRRCAHRTVGLVPAAAAQR